MASKRRLLVFLKITQLNAVREDVSVALKMIFNHLSTFNVI